MFVCDENGKNLKQISSDNGIYGDHAPAFTADDTGIVTMVFGDFEDGSCVQLPMLFDLINNTHRYLIDEWDESICHGVHPLRAGSLEYGDHSPYFRLTKDGKYLYFQTGRHGRFSLCRVRIDAAKSETAEVSSVTDSVIKPSPVEMVLEGQTDIQEFSMNENGQIVTIQADWLHPAELWMNGEKLTDSNPWLSEYALADVEEHWVKSKDGKADLQYFLVKPVSFEKNKQYRAILVKKNLILPNNEVLLDYTSVLDRELEKLNASSSIAVLAAISPNDKTKFLIQPNQIETIILNNIRKNDILMNYAVNKYFLLLFDTDIDGAQRIWAKIQSQIPEKIYAGFTKTFSKTRQQLVNEVLNKLHEAINYEKVYSNMTAAQSNVPRTNFKMFKQEFNKKIERIINPVFYHIRQKYNDKLFGVTIEQENIEGGTILHLKERHAVAAFKMTSPGFSKINIDITFSSSPENIDAKRISLNPDELEAGVLEDLLEQFIAEFRKEVNNDNTKYR